MREPLTIDDVLNARMIADPFTVRDCCLVTDGAGAFVLSRADDTQRGPNAPIYVLGNATACWNRQISSMPDLTVTAASQSGAQAFAMAGLQAKDMDVVELYDAFTINTLLFLEDLGFVKKGEAGAFVASGAIAPGGSLAVNTNGGGLSCVHPGMYGIFALIEAVRQLRGNCGERQATAILGTGGHLVSLESQNMIRDHETLEALLGSVRRFVRERLVPAENEVAETDEIPEAIVQEMRELGCFGLTIPEQFGGLELTMEEEVRVLLELCQTAPAFRSMIGTTVGIGSQGILMDGTDAQKAEWLPRMATGEVIASFALTEPEADPTRHRCAPRPSRMATTMSSTAPSALSPTRRTPACSP
ncbi:hypothetical protein FQA39_LY19218 [Lamprigera yunnana]|nr:hypothetical protein FQA39_LY19218 [Lamprigera yunnana]